MTNHQIHEVASYPRLGQRPKTTSGIRSIDVRSYYSDIYAIPLEGASFTRDEALQVSVAHGLSIESDHKRHSITIMTSTTSFEHVLKYRRVVACPYSILTTGAIAP